MGKVDTAGVYIFEVIESGLGVTQKNSYPQWVARLKAVKKWVETAEEMAHFSIAEPAYVDWSTYNEEAVGFLVLFNSADNFIATGDGKTAMLNYEQLQTALGWDGTEFDSLSNGAFLGKQLQGRMEEDTWEGKTSVKLNWIDAADAPAQRQLKVLAPDLVKALTAKLAIGGIAKKKPAAAPAKPTAAKPGATPPKPTPAPTAAPAAAPAPVASDAPVAGTAPTSPSKPAAPKAPKAPKAATLPPPPAPTTDTVPGLPGQATQLEAWEYVCTNKGGNTDDAVQEAWIAASAEVLADRDQDSATPAEWAKVRDIVIRDLALTATAAAA